MLCRRTVAWGNLAGLVTFSMMSTLVFVLTLYFEETLDLSAFRTGLIFGVAGVLSAVAGAYASKVIGRFGARRTLVGSLVGQGVLTGALLCVNADEVCRGLLTANAPLSVNCCSNVTTLAESLTDPVPRRDVSGALVAVGHVGTIYQATNAVYMGRATPRTVKLLPNGVVLNERMAQKVRRQEQGHEYAERLLIGLGASVLRAGADPKVWLREALVAVGARNQRHRGVHRYVYRLGRNRRERESIRLGLPAIDTFPKTPDGR